MKTILVLGGAGYIGSHTVYELIDNGYDVVVADNLETGFRKAVHPKARFYQGDIRNKEFCDHVFSSEKIDAVIHFAANSQVGESMVNPLKYYDNNLGGTRTMLQSMIEHGVKYIVFSSTAATYGEPERVPILETDPTHPTNCYGETKLSMERMFYWASVAHGIHFVALRYFNACGAHMSGKIGEAHNPETHLIPIVLQVPNGQRDHVSIFGDDYPTRDGTCVRDYIHVTDLASAHILARGISDERRRKQRVQPRQRRRLHRQGDHRHGGEGRRQAHQVRDGGAARGRPGAVSCVLAKRRRRCSAGSRSTTTLKPSSVPRGTGTRSIRMAMKIETRISPRWIRCSITRRTVACCTRWTRPSPETHFWRN